jgi:hypothetical protein
MPKNSLSGENIWMRLFLIGFLVVNQLLYEVDVDGYVHVVPVIREPHTLFLKTIYPSRKATRKRRKGEAA